MYKINNKSLFEYQFLYWDYFIFICLLFSGMLAIDGFNDQFFIWLFVGLKTFIMIADYYNGS